MPFCQACRSFFFAFLPLERSFLQKNKKIDKFLKNSIYKKIRIRYTIDNKIIMEKHYDSSSF